MENLFIWYIGLLNAIFLSKINVEFAKWIYFDTEEKTGCIDTVNWCEEIS